MNAGRYNHMTDDELLANYRQDSNQEWIGILLERYTMLLLGVCMKYLKNEEEAKDSVQQIFLKVLTDAHKYQIEFFKSWLYMVAKNFCLMKLRNNASRNIQELTDIAMEESREKNDWLENEKTYALLEDAIQELNEEQKQCVILFYLQKNSYNQITQKTGFNLSQVKSYLQNGKRNLKLILEKKLKQNNAAKR
ncbi:MAG TPA: sigma-70 family RNA polymerase sigma factor [Flavisolibacter sp.]|nr:sigma-70 family RNA polymerase sigma factor [Flavisolibacter sp.]